MCSDNSDTNYSKVFNFLCCVTRVLRETEQCRWPWRTQITLFSNHRGRVVATMYMVLKSKRYVIKVLYISIRKINWKVIEKSVKQVSVQRQVDRYLCVFFVYLSSSFTPEMSEQQKEGKLMLIINTQYAWYFLGAGASEGLPGKRGLHSDGSNPSPSSAELLGTASHPCNSCWGCLWAWHLWSCAWVRKRF